MRRVFVRYYPVDGWVEAIRGCHPVEMDGKFPLVMSEARFGEILAWARRVPGWDDGILVAKPAREGLLEYARELYASGRMSKTQVAGKIPLFREDVMRALSDDVGDAA